MLTAGDSLAVDLDGDGDPEVQFRVAYSSGFYSASISVDSGVAVPVTSSLFWDFVVNQHTSINLPPGTGPWMSSTDGFLNVGFAFTTFGFIYDVGDFPDGAPGNIGVRLQINPGEYQYGWIEYTADLHLGSFGGTVGRWALETEPNRPITPGDTGICDPFQAGEGGGCFIKAGTE
jgi:hypothetical protein